jgi:hypothetical protein
VSPLKKERKVGKEGGREGETEMEKKMLAYYHLNIIHVTYLVKIVS